MVEDSLKYIENKCSHCALLLIVEKMPIVKEILDMLELGHKPSQVILFAF